MKKKKQQTSKDVKKEPNKNKSVSFNPSKRLRITMLITFFLLFALIFRLGWLQFVQGADLKERTSKQLTTSRIISTKRGTIYDSTGKKLAMSASVDTVTINPTKIVEKDPNKDTEIRKTNELKEKVAKAFSDIFELDYNETLKKVSSTNSLETIVKKVEKDKIDQLRNWMKENEIYSGINIDEDTKRYYPYDTLASSLIGFCGSDNQGLEGLEAKWDSVLTGTPGKIVTAKDAVQEFIPDKDETYIPPENGSNITLTIDLTIQSIAEKYLKQAVTENDCKNGGSVIIMNPKNGDILAMANYPDYNLNTPFEVTDYLKNKGWDSLSSEEQANTRQKLWNNRAVTDTYEPGSVFKIITAAVALEEGFANTDTQNDFYCSGSEKVLDRTIKCTNSNGDKEQSLRLALENSCNPAFIQLSKRIGATTLYKYIDAFGFFKKTGIATPGEGTSLFHSLENVGPVELATTSFGQRFTITPLQMITAACAVLNDGYLMQPRIVKQVENSDTNVITTIEPVQVAQVVSKETSKKMCDMLESVVSEGGGKYGQVKGYTIGGKTGTSEPDPNKPEDGYVASFFGFAPVENSSVAVLLTLYGPQGKLFYGGRIAAPVVSQILSEVLPYLGIPSDETEQQQQDSSTTISLTDVRNKTVAEAKKILENAGLNCLVSGSLDAIVSDQVPKPGTSLTTESIVKLYSVGNDARVSNQVPDLKGMTIAQARNALKSKNLNIRINGTGKVISQDIAAFTLVEEGSVVTVNLQEEIHNAH